MKLYASVGLGGVNRVDDTRTVQRLLIVEGHSAGPVDGRRGRLTIGAIVALQDDLMRRAANARIDVGGPSWRRLRGARNAQPFPRFLPRDPP